MESDCKYLPGIACEKCEKKCLKRAKQVNLLDEIGFRIYGDLTNHIDVKVECIMDINIIKQCAQVFTALGVLYNIHDWAEKGADVKDLVVIVHGPVNCEFGLIKTEYGTVKIRSSKLLPPGGFALGNGSEPPKKAEKPKFELVKG